MIYVDCLCTFALFLQRIQYIFAAILIREQALAEPPILKVENRLGIQVWHILVAVLLWASISETYTAGAIRQCFTDIFTLDGVL